MHALSINGDWPSLEGEVLQELICQQMYHAGRLVEPAHVTYLKVADAWLRLYFDFAIIFWRPTNSPPQPYDMSEVDCEFQTRDVGRECGLRGEIIARLSAQLVERGVEVSLEFVGGKCIVFQSIDDVSSYRSFVAPAQSRA